MRKYALLKGYVAALNLNIVYHLMESKTITDQYQNLFPFQVDASIEAIGDKIKSQKQYNSISMSQNLITSQVKNLILIHFSSIVGKLKTLS